MSTASTPAPLVGIIMGSRSDWPVMEHAAAMLDRLGVPYEAKVVSAHRTPRRLYEYAAGAEARGLKIIIAGAGGAAHLPGMAAAITNLPVLGVPVAATALQGQDALLAIVQMPGGVPVGTLAIGKPGAINAGLLAASILALSDPALRARVAALRAEQTAQVPETPV
ncbi:5-(carboxyamino)imidazole ribonucleotide mutase [Acidocella sp.]|uniref:5-(carboxyamino)imidazole ribonucleotide mutase n=1 Tax=Acidocella sp. TaxID=50710 RepID=UPI002603F782|nr:5-(carboxyamino)imidazole ribonucleotide mutase [Acidocella sp.]